MRQALLFRTGETPEGDEAARVMSQEELVERVPQDSARPARTTTTRSTDPAMKLYAIADLHLRYEVTRQALRACGRIPTTG